MQLLYFGWVRGKIGIDRETLDLPNDIKDVNDLVVWLRARGGGYAEALADPVVVRVAVNQELVEFDQPVASGDEVALFPPMTGG